MFAFSPNNDDARDVEEDAVAPEAARFRFCGNPNDETDERDSVEAYGLVFSGSDFTEVSDALVIEKLRGNTHFEEDAD
jgi:hypothetical protein